MPVVALLHRVGRIVPLCIVIMADLQAATTAIGKDRVAALIPEIEVLFRAVRVLDKVVLVDVGLIIHRDKLDRLHRPVLDQQRGQINRRNPVAVRRVRRRGIANLLHVRHTVNHPAACHQVERTDRRIFDAHRVNIVVIQVWQSGNLMLLFMGQQSNRAHTHACAGRISRAQRPVPGLHTQETTNGSVIVFGVDVPGATGRRGFPGGDAVIPADKVERYDRLVAERIVIDVVPNRFEIAVPDAAGNGIDKPCKRQRAGRWSSAGDARQVDRIGSRIRPEIEGHRAQDRFLVKGAHHHGDLQPSRIIRLLKSGRTTRIHIVDGRQRRPWSGVEQLRLHA